MKNVQEEWEWDLPSGSRARGASRAENSNEVRRIKLLQLKERQAMLTKTSEGSNHLRALADAADLYEGEPVTFWKHAYGNLVRALEGAAQVDELSEMAHIVRELFQSAAISNALLNDNAWPDNLLRSIVQDTKHQHVCGRCGQTKHYASTCFCAKDGNGKMLVKNFHCQGCKCEKGYRRGPKPQDGTE